MQIFSPYDINNQFATFATFLDTTLVDLTADSAAHAGKTGFLPLGSIQQFGTVLFDGPSDPGSQNLSFDHPYMTVMDAAYPIDPFGIRASIFTKYHVTYKYAILPDWAAVQSGSLSVAQSLEQKFSALYTSLRQHNNQRAQLIVQGGSVDAPSPFMACDARIESLKLGLTPGKDLRMYLVDLEFSPLSEWTPVSSTYPADPLPTRFFPSFQVNGQPNRVFDLGLPFGNLKAFIPSGAHSTDTNRIWHFEALPAGGFGGIGVGHHAATYRTTIPTKQDVAWTTSFSSLPNNVFPVDHYGFGPCPMKPIDVTWEYLFLSSSYEGLWGQVNDFLLYWRGKGLSDLNPKSTNQRGLLQVYDANPVAAKRVLYQAPARIRSLPVSISIKNPRHYSMPVTFTLLGDWKKVT